jgi:hypothetical protein
MFRLAPYFDGIMDNAFQQNSFVMSLSIRIAWIKQMNLAHLYGMSTTAILYFGAKNVSVVQHKVDVPVEMENVEMKCPVVIIVFYILYSMTLVRLLWPVI